MKLRYIFFLVTLAMISCEEVVHVDLDTAAPRLVVEASINWVKGTDGAQQTIRLTKTTAYYADEIPVATGATVTMTDSDGAVFNFIEVPNTGNYVCSEFAPQIGMTYTLDILYEGEHFSAEETMYSVPEIGLFEQDNDGGFFGDEIEVKFFYQDNPSTEDHYMVRFDTDVLAFPQYEVASDQFTNGNLNFSTFSDEDLKAGDVLDIQLYGISKRYYNYMQKLLSVASAGGGGPFGTPPATVRGNVRNTTQEKRFPLGYFRLSEVDTVSYTVQ